MKTPLMLLAFAAFSLSALAADVTGTWKSVTPVRKFYVVHLAAEAPAA